MKWVTRERPKIDRLASPWLVTRFVDPAAEFLFVPAESVTAVAPEAAGLQAISVGLGRVFDDDHALLDHAMVVYDALYAWCRGDRERHGWSHLS